MGFFGKKKEDTVEAENDELEQVETKIEKLQNEFSVKYEENEKLEGRIKIVKEEYDATISNLMMIKKELNQKKLELDVVQRKHKSILEKIKGFAEIKDDKKGADFIQTEGNFVKIKQELEIMTKEHQKIKEEISQGQLKVHNIRKQQIDVEKELEDANSRLYNAKDELGKKEQFQDTSVLTSKEKEFIQSENTKDKSSAGIIEAASVVVGSLKSKLNTTQKELDSIQDLLEKERKSHAETRKELNRLKLS